VALPSDTSWSASISDARSELEAAQSRIAEEVIGFFDQLRAPLLRYVLTFGLAGHDAEDVVQETFLALFQHLRNGKPRDNLKAWVFRVSHNLALKQRLRIGRWDQSSCPEEVAEMVLHPQLNPEEQFADAQHRQRMLRAIEDMPEMDRCCLFLRAEGLRYRDIAAIVGLSLGGVSLALGRALTQLRKVGS